MERGLQSALHKAVTLLAENGYSFAVIGGIAVSVWGQTRATYDIDIKVLVPENGYDSIRALIRDACPERARPHTAENSLIIDTIIDGVIIDFLLALPGYEENIINRAVSKKLDEYEVPVCAPEDLIIQKVIAGRPRDWQDIEGILIEQHGKLDREYMEEWLGQFAEVLEQPSMLSQYNSIKTRIDALVKSRKDIA
jgi:hypothetical protein